MQFKLFGCLSKQKVLRKRLFGRNEHDSGLYEYIFELADIYTNDDMQTMVDKLTSQVGEMVDGKFLFARFAKTCYKKPYLLSR